MWLADGSLNISSSVEGPAELLGESYMELYDPDGKFVHGGYKNLPRISADAGQTLTIIWKITFVPDVLIGIEQIGS